MPYPPRVLEYFERRPCAGSFPEGDAAVGTGFVEASSHGDIVRLQLRMTEDGGRIAEARFKAYGCGWTIACASFAAERLAGLTLGDALALDRATLVRELALPGDKVHCAELAERGVAAAVADVRRKRAGSEEP
jgi:NifU-like protein involved in Fe-S cluster formation